jgi:hypothetical protein
MSVSVVKVKAVFEEVVKELEKSDTEEVRRLREEIEDLKLKLEWEMDRADAIDEELSTLRQDEKKPPFLKDIEMSGIDPLEWFLVRWDAAESKLEVSEVAYREC